LAKGFGKAQGCHPERSEGSGTMGREILRCAQDDKTGFARGSSLSALRRTAGPGGAIWFIEYGKIGRITTKSNITKFTTPI